MAHHDAGEKIAQRSRSGVVTAGFTALVGNKAVPLHRGAKLQAVKRLAVHGCDGPLRLALFARTALSELPRGDFFQIRFDFEHSSSNFLLRGNFSISDIRLLT